jgi:energy-coupling factor transporter transmembrane protein EcfT
MPARNKPIASNQPDTLAVLALIFGVVSFMGPGLLLGIPAIVIAGVALKKNVAGRGLSIAGLVMGIISTVLSLLLLALLVFFIIWGATNAGSLEYDEYPTPQQQESPFQGSRT